MKGLILYTYNVLERKQDLAAFYEDLFHGRMPAGYLEKKKPIYESFGFTDPLTDYTRSIASALQEEDLQVYIASKHSSPSIETAVEYALKHGCTTLYILGLTPFISKTGTVFYEQKVQKTIERLAPQTKLISLNGFGQEPKFIELMAKRVFEAMIHLHHREPKIIFTSHSLPGTEKTNAAFIAQLEHTANEIMKALPKAYEYRIAYRSLGPKGQKWLGPDILQVLEEEHANGTEAVVVCELLSIIENMEVLEEIGQAAKEKALWLGMEFIQTRYLNNSYDFVDFLKTYLKINA